MGKKAQKSKKKLAKKTPAPVSGDRRAFDQLLDDAIFGVKKKNPRD